MDAAPRTFNPAPATPPVVPDYELIRRIGRGSYGEVWLARNIMGGFRAIKIVYRHSFGDERPFEREFSGIKRFEPVSRSHPSFVTIFHVGRNPAAGYFYYVMELADDAARGGEISPEDYQPKMLRRQNSFSAADCLALGISLAGALVHLHQAGLIHRDIKPSNIIYVNGVPKLADIGLVAEAGESHSFVGTEGFVPPEGSGSAQADLYSLGKTLYEILTGKDRHDFPQLPPGWVKISDHRQRFELNEVILRACERNRAARYQKAEAMLADLQRIAQGQSVKKMRALRSLSKTVLLVLGLCLFIGTGWKLAEKIFHSAPVGISSERQLHILLKQARATRLGRQFGHRTEALRIIAEATAIHPTPELRDEAIATLALTDIETKLPPQEIPNNATAYTFDQALQHYAIGASDGELRIGSFEGKPVQVLHEAGEKPWVDLLHFSPKNDFLAVRYNQLSCWIWDLKKTNVVLKTRWGTDMIKPDRAMDFSPRGNRAANAVTENVIRLFELPEWTHGPALEIRQKPSWLAFDPSGAQLAVVAGNRVDIWNTDALKLEKSLEHPVEVFCADWHPDGNRLAVGSRVNDIFLWDIPTHSRKILSGHNALILRVGFHPEGDLLSSTARDATSCIWDVASGQPLLRNDEGYSWNFSANGQRLGFIRERQNVSVFEVQRSPVFRTMDAQLSAMTRIRSLDPSPDGKHIMISSEQSWSIIDFHTARILTNVPLPGISAARFGNGGEIFTGSMEGARRWQWKEVGKTSTKTLSQQELVLTNSGLSALKIQGERLVAATETETALHILSKPQERFTFSDIALTGGSNICDIAASPDGRWLAVCGWYAAGTIVWETEKTSPPKILGGRTARLLFTSDGEWLVTSTAEELVFWNTSDWSPDWRLPQQSPRETPPAFAISPDQKLLAMMDSASTIQLFEINTRKRVAALTAPVPQQIAEICFSHDGIQLVAATAAGTIQIWNLPPLRDNLRQLGFAEIGF